MRIWTCSLVVVSVAALGAGACSSSKSTGGSGGTGGATASGGSAGSGAGAGSGGSSGSGGMSGSGGADGGSCQGDATQWAAITQGPVTCTKNSDCCVVINNCVNEAQVVSKQDYDKGAASLWPTCDNQCTACIAPAVDVVCDNGECGLEQLDPMDASAGKSTDHCGTDGMLVVAPVKVKVGCN